MNLDTKIQDTFASFFGFMLESFCYGIYCVIFVAFIRVRLKRRDKGSKVLLCLVIANFIACTAFLAVGAVPTGQWGLSLASNALYMCVDFISQVILIYRCWIMWRQPWVMVVPILLTVGFLAMSVTTNAGTLPSSSQATPDWIRHWYLPAVLSFFSLSLVVNALVTGLIVSKIVAVYRDMIQRGQANRLKRDIVLIITILIESGTVTFAVQLVQTLMIRFDNTEFPIIYGSVVMIYGISTAIVLVRVEMGLTYEVDNESSKTTMRFAASHVATTSESQQP